MNFVTPTHYSLEVAKAVTLARQHGLFLPVVWNTSSYEREEVIRYLAKTVDVWLADYKYADSSLSSRYSHAPDYPAVALKAIEAMAEFAGSPCFDSYQGQKRMKKGVIVRHLMLPEALEQSKQALSMLWERFGDSVLYSIMNQYTPVVTGKALSRNPELGVRVTDEEYDELLDYVDSLGMGEYFWQDGPAAEESFIPIWDCSGV